MYLATFPPLELWRPRRFLLEAEGTVCPVFEAWCKACSESTDLFRIATVEKLCRFIMEARRQDGETQRYLHGNGRHEILFFSASHLTFAHLEGRCLLLQREWELSLLFHLHFVLFSSCWSAIIPFLSLHDTSNAFSVNFHFDQHGAFK